MVSDKVLYRRRVYCPGSKSGSSMYINHIVFTNVLFYLDATCVRAKEIREGLYLYKLIIHIPFVWSWRIVVPQVGYAIYVPKSPDDSIVTRLPMSERYGRHNTRSVLPVYYAEGKGSGDGIDAGGSL